MLQASTTTRSSRKRDPGTMRVPASPPPSDRESPLLRSREGPPPVALDHPRLGEGGPGQPPPPGAHDRCSPWGGEPASGMLRAPPGAGPRRVKAMEVPGAARFTALCGGAPMHKGPPAPGAHRAGTFGLFRLPGGCPRRLAPELADPAAAEEAEGSIARRSARGRSSTGRSG
jgi:hypothetical protein